MPRGVLGMNAEMFRNIYTSPTAVLQIGLPQQYLGRSTFRMSEIMDLKKEKNFFETRVTEYQTGGTLSWDE